MGDKKTIAQLFNKYVEGKTNDLETAELLSYFGNEEDVVYLNTLLSARFDEQTPADDELLYKLQPLTDRVSVKLNSFLNENTPSPRKVNYLYVWSGIAASILLAVCLLFLYNRPDQHQPAKKLAFDASPGGNKATIILSNGKTIGLDSTKTSISISGSQITYSDGSMISSEATEIATVRTPRGGQYSIELPDGTTVTLNAASSLKFPSSFSRLVNRTVELAGEGYFTVAKDKRHPFIVKSKDQQIEVLGTQFNVAAYDNERSIKTTLLEGSVKLSTAHQTRVLKPGQQAQVSDQAITSVDAIDVDDAVAWKNGYFIFNEDLQSIMNKIARWYDLEIVYEGQFDQSHLFQGKITRSRNLSEVLRMMEYSGKVHFKTEGRKVIVTK